MDIKNIIVILVIGIILFEVIEHIAIPIVFYVIKRKKRSVTGIESLLGEVVEVREWKEKEIHLKRNGCKGILILIY